MKTREREKKVDKVLSDCGVKDGKHGGLTYDEFLVLAGLLGAFGNLLRSILQPLKNLRYCPHTSM